MKKLKDIKIKEFDRIVLSVDILLYIFIAACGLLLLKVSNYNDIDSYLCSECFLIVIGFISMIAYFVNRREGNYEYLLFSCINIICGIVLIVNESYVDRTIIMSNVYLFYFILYIINKIYNSCRLYRLKNVNYIIKLSIGMVLGVFGIYVSCLLSQSYTTGNYLLGIYFGLFGLISIIEPLCEFLLRNPKIENKVKKFLKYDIKEKKTTKKVVKVREMPSKKIKKINKK